MVSSASLLETVNLTKFISLKKSIRVLERITRTIKEAPIVSDVSFKIEKGESFGLIGLPGCGKSVLTGLILKNFSPTAGKIFFEGKDIDNVEDEALHQSIKTIFFDPTPSINRSESFYFPSEIVKAVELEKRLSKGKIEHWDALTERKVELAMALASKPKLIIIDEYLKTLSKKDLLKMLKILKNTKDQFDLTYLFIHDDLGVIKNACERFAVMFRGKIVEINTKENVHAIGGPRHPFTEMLEFYSKEHKFPYVWRSTECLREASYLNPFKEIPGCQFHPFCPRAMDICTKEEPRLFEVQDKRAKIYVACFLF